MVSWMCSGLEMTRGGMVSLASRAAAVAILTSTASPSSLTAPSALSGGRRSGDPPELGAVRAE